MIAARQGRDPVVRPIAWAVWLFVTPLIWVIGGVIGNWHDSAVTAAWVGLASVGVMAATYLWEGRLLRYLTSLVFEAIVPAVVLTWAYGHGRTWLWMLGWMWAAILLLGGVMPAQLHYMSRGLRSTQLVAAISLVAALVLANLRAPVGIVVALLLIACTASVAAGIVTWPIVKRFYREERHRSRLY